jgi:hypothetical protein
MHERFPSDEYDDASACSEHVIVDFQELHPYTRSSRKCSCNDVLKASICAIVSRVGEHNDKDPSFTASVVLINPVNLSRVVRC